MVGRNTEAFLRQHDLVKQNGACSPNESEGQSHRARIGKGTKSLKEHLPTNNKIGVRNETKSLWY